MRESILTESDDECLRRKQSNRVSYDNRYYALHLRSGYMYSNLIP